MNLYNGKLVFYWLNSWLVVAVQGLEIGPPCENGIVPTNCMLKNGRRGSSDRLCKKPETLQADVWCNIKTDHTFDLYYCCEEPYFEGRVSPVGGVLTRPGEFPYMAALGWYSIEHLAYYDFKCGAVMISNKFALTAAHCAIVDDDEPIMVLPGGRSLRNNFDLHYTIDKVYEYPDYDPDFVYNDIALIKLYGKYTGPILELWRRPDIANTNFTAIGYGDTTFAGTSSEDLLKVFLQLVATNDCQRFYKPNFERPQGVIGSQICAKDSKNIMDTCQGDSGGPLIMTTYGNGGVKKEYLVGITSFGQGCALTPPGVYTRVSAYFNWINNITNREATVENRNSDQYYYFCTRSNVCAYVPKKIEYVKFH